MSARIWSLSQLGQTPGGPRADPDPSAPNGRNGPEGVRRGDKSVKLSSCGRLLRRVQAAAVSTPQPRRTRWRLLLTAVRLAKGAHAFLIARAVVAASTIWGKDGLTASHVTTRTHTQCPLHGHVSPTLSQRRGRRRRQKFGESRFLRGQMRKLFDRRPSLMLFYVFK